MSYFTAVMASDGRGWRARDVDVEDAASLDDLADSLRSVSRADHPVLAVIEHEDEWFALVRVDGEEDPRLFVSDMAAASRGAFAQLLAPAGDVDVPAGLIPVDGAKASGSAEQADDDAGAAVIGDDTSDAGVASDDRDDDAFDDTALDEDVDLGDLVVDEPPPAAPWAGHADLLADLGVEARAVLELCQEHSDDPATVLSEIGEQAGFAELIEALR